MPIPYTPLAVANEFIFRSSGAGVEHMKLQKLVYISYGWWLAYHETNLLSEGPEVWQHGPVFSSLYQVLKEFGRSPITNLQRDNPFASAPRVDENDADVCALIEWVWSRYGKHSAFYLSNLTHQPGSPWEAVARSHNFRVPMHTKIPNPTIAEHYKILAKDLNRGAGN